jgi:CRP-like cAMP-binding protein
MHGLGGLLAERSMPFGTVSTAPRPAVRPNKFLAALAPDDAALLAPHLRTLWLERGIVLHEPGGPIEHVYFPHGAMVSMVALMQDGTSVETVTLGRAGVVGGSAALGTRRAVGRAIVQLPGAASRLPAAQFYAAARQSERIRELAVGYNDLLLAQTQQSVACNALHALEARLCRWLLQTRDSVDGDTIPLTQEFLGQMLGVRRTSVTVAARLLQSAGMIRYRRGQITIVDRRALEDLSCECYGVIRQQIDQMFPASQAPG